MRQPYVYFIFLLVMLGLLFVGTPHFSRLHTDVINSKTPLARSMWKNVPRMSSVVEPSLPWLECEGGRERKRLAYPKNHKVGGTTFSSILSRYAYTKRLNVVIPKPWTTASRMYPYRLYPKYYMPPPPNQTFDIFLHHVVYNRKRFPQIMPKDTAYVTIIRKPLNHLKSAWSFYHYKKRLRLSKSKNPIATFLADPAKYDHNCGHGIHLPVCFTQNSISVDLGFPPSDNKKVTLGSDPDRREEITQKFVQTIDQDFDLVMLAEYYDESLVLLKRLMCWTMQDIVYFKSSNVRNRHGEEIQLPSELRQTHKDWSYVDYALYDHFNRSLWRRINSSGNDYWGEVKYFKELNKEILHHCQDPCSFHKGKPPFEVNSTRWGPGFTVDSDMCLLLRRDFSCHMFIQAERVGKSLRLPQQKHRRGKPTNPVMAVVTPYCIYCALRKGLRKCENLDTLSHFYRDGYISEEVYQETSQQLCGNHQTKVGNRRRRKKRRSYRKKM
ncbi:galactose-3-O-sulfotransferase 3-like [Branchiostoma lanceolatum]|uniref:galactose-3-O-sulfotransferase 3-like n=1 Tax=Branchiostoma lanceolatum TaxID=7740 RepID=UPI0034555A3D